jgi:FkbM family methyltransferase
MNRLRDAIRKAFLEALSFRDEGPVGTPLRALYMASSKEIERTAARTFWREPIEVTLPELVSCEIHRYGLIEPGLTALFIDRVAPGTVVYDIGAHHGYYSLLAAALGAQVHAFEPAEHTLPTLRRNVGDRVRVVAKGAWSRDTMLELMDFGSAHSAVNTFVSSRDEALEAPTSTYEVPVVSIDGYVSQQSQPPRLIKIDAEGAERDVLQGAATTLRSAKPLVAIEVGDTQAEFHSREAIEFAAELGYAPFDMKPEGVRPHAKRERYSYGNILLIHTDFEEGT